MNPRSPLDEELERLISSYADRAPVTVEPVAMTRLAAQAARWTPTMTWGILRRLRPSAGLAVSALAVVVLLAGSVLAGVRLSTTGADPSVSPGASADQFIAPFVGIAPPAAPPSSPEAGSLLLSFEARFEDPSVMHYRLFLFDDGRLLWTSEGGLHGLAPPNAVVEQRLTPLGVLSLMGVAESSSQLLGPAPPDGPEMSRERAGVLWGGMALSTRGELRDADWNADLPARLLDPAGSLPAAAWGDARIRAYVPARYALCAWLGDGGPPPGASALDALPERVRDLVNGADDVTVADTECRSVPAPMAHSIADELDGAGYVHQGREDVGPRWESAVLRVTVDILPILPNGWIVCNCG